MFLFHGSRSCVAVLLTTVLLLAGGRESSAATVNPHNIGSCASCHTGSPRFGIDTRRDVGFLTSADNPGLCLACHPAGKHAHPVNIAAGSGPAGARVSGYLPAGNSAAWAGKIVCTSCHFIHAADGRYSLLRGYPGTPDPRYFASEAAFCNECHGGNLASRAAHGGGERACVFCHAGAPVKLDKGDSAGGPGERCAVCHDKLGPKHAGKRNPFNKPAGCLHCHDRHAVASSSPGLLSQEYRAAAADSVVIRPHYSRSLCFACHANLDDYALRADGVNATCDRCHASGQITPNIHPLRAVPPTVSVPKGWPLTDGALTCLTCHEQGHEDQAPRRYMLRGGPYESGSAVCRNCHAASDLGKSRIHEQINESKGCEMCHRARPQPGVDTVATVTFIADPDLLCMRCHEQNSADGSVHHSGVLGREIEAGHLPVDLPMYKGRVICATCHNPHLRNPAGLRLRAALDGSELCSGCHRE